MIKVFVDLSGSRRLGKLIKMNDHTCWVKIMFGARTYRIIKRHFVKHHIFMRLEDQQ